MQQSLGNYFVVTSGYSKHGGMVSPLKKAVLFVSEDGLYYREASQEETKKFHNLHPVLK